MGWSYGEIDGKQVGYGVDATCEEPGCNAKIDRGLAYACGEYPGDDEVSCAGFFCDEHLIFTSLTELGPNESIRHPARFPNGSDFATTCKRCHDELDRWALEELQARMDGDA